MSGPLIYRQAPGFVVREIGSHTVLVPVHGVSGALTLLLEGPVALRLWEALADGASLAALVARVQGEFEVGEGEAEADVRAFLEQLLALGCATGA